jgi:hypothetical protein
MQNGSSLFEWDLKLDIIGFEERLPGVRNFFRLAFELPLRRPHPKERNAWIETVKDDRDGA